MSLRTKVLFWIIAVNLGIAVILLTTIHSSVDAQREAHLRTLQTIEQNSEEIIERLSNILLFEEELARLDEEDITPQSIINWPQWDFFDDALVLKDYVRLDNEIVYTDIELNPLGSRRRSLSYDREAARDMMRRAIDNDCRVTKGDMIAVPIHVRASDFDPSQSVYGPSSNSSSKVWGAAFVRPRFPNIEGIDVFYDLTVFWTGLLGGTLILIVATYVILSRLVIRPVEEIAGVADRVAHGDFTQHCADLGTGDEVGRLVHSFNYMVDEVGDYHRDLQERIAEVRERVQLAERHLTVAQRLASTGKLAAGIAHEINNPIGGMINAAIRLKEGVEEGSRSEVYLGLIIEGLERIKHTVRNILAFSPRKVDPQPFAIAAIIEDAAAFVGHRLKEDEIALRIDVTPTTLKVVCDSGEIRQVFLNILINATDAIASAESLDRGEGSIEIDTRYDPVERMVVTEVTDNGDGMDEDTLLHAFDPFYSTKAAGEGTGLGLSIAHNIITSHGGRIEVDSVVGKGTVIRILLHKE